MSKISIRDAGDADAAAISALILAVAEAQITHEFSEQGRQTMLSRLSPGDILRLMWSGYRYHVAEQAGELAGVVAMRGYSHLYHLFVSRSAQNRGIGRQLWQHAAAVSRRELSLRQFTVFSSRYAEPVYRAFGFVRTGGEKTKRGVVAIPMHLEIID